VTTELQLINISYIYHLSGVSSAHHQKHKTVHTASDIVKPILLPAAIVDEMELTLYVQFYAPDDGRSNRLKHVEQFIEINRWRKRCILLVVL
jgi:hypothetical protein